MEGYTKPWWLVWWYVGRMRRQHDSNNQIMDIDWEAEWDNLSNDDREPFGSREEPGPNYTEVGSEVVGPVPLLNL